MPIKFANVNNCPSEDADNYINQPTECDLNSVIYPEDLRRKKEKFK